jgi:hypothetical protein
MPTCSHKIDKQHISAMITFALKNIPDTDEVTLKKLRELIHTGGSFGSITTGQLAYMMGLMKKYIPGTCDYSLLVIVDLLGVFLPLPEGKDVAKIGAIRSIEPG